MRNKSRVAPIAIGTVAALGVLALAANQYRGGVEPQIAPIASHATAPSAATMTPQPMLPAPPTEAAPATPDAALSELIAESERLNALARYPRWSQPLDLLGDALAEQQQTVRVQSSQTDAAQAVLTVYAEHRTFDAPEPVVIRAEVTTSSGPSVANITATVSDSTGQALTELQFSSVGHSYTASFVPPQSAGANAGYSVRVHALPAGHDPREVTIELMYNQPYARLTGNFRDRVANGDLVIEAEVSVQRAAEFRLNGSLYGAADQQQIACAEVSGKLPAGMGWLALKFHGLILREQQVDGPYLLRFAALTTHTAEAEASMRPVQDAYTTQPYDADAFDGEARQDKKLLAEAASLRARIERLRRQLPEDLRARATD